jgi:sugar lactone lactonase YvrE
MTETLVSGLCFGEGPRWHAGALWFSDMHARTVFKVTGRGELSKVVKLDGDEPSGLGWLPDGRLLVVSMTRRQLLVESGVGLDVLADLSTLATFHCNDMVTDSAGRSYVGNFGFDLHNNATPSVAEIVLVTPQGDARVVADEMAFPNGTVITPDGRTLIVGESMGRCLIEPNGDLCNRRIWAALEGALPDGICLDAENGIWVASPISHEALRVVEGGAVTDRVRVENQAFACMLGGKDRRTLYIMTSPSSRPEECKQLKSAAIETVRVQIPGAGQP